jgi:concanavalin A-like lectin/glucanase superfamily protein
MNLARTILITALFSITAVPPALAKNLLRAGVSSVDISPPQLPIILSGGFLAKSVNQMTGSLHARALVLDDGENRIVIAVADSLMLPRGLLDEVKEAASNTTGIPVNHMLISATHTHSAPPVMGALGTDANLDYAELMRERLTGVIEEAAKRLRPARIGWAVIQASDHTHCRRWILRPDKVRKDPFGERTVRAHMHPGYQNPEFIGPSGPVDPDLTLLAAQSPAGKPIALLANYSMHYVGSNQGVSPDYYGPFVDKMRALLGVKQHDTSFVAMMSQGTSGDQHWMDYSQTKKEMSSEIYADAMAGMAYEAYRTIHYRDWVPVDIQEKKLTLLRRVPDEQRLAWARKAFADLPDGRPTNQMEVYAREQILLAQNPVCELKLQALRIGDLGIASFPNEVYAITGLKIKEQSPLQPTFNIELANGAEGYIPPPEQHLLGGYTTWPARTAALEVEAEPRIVDTLLGLLEEVSGQPRRPREETHGAYAKAVLAARPLAYWRGSEIAGTQALDATGNHRSGHYEGGVALYLEGPESPAFSGSGWFNRAPHYAGGHMRATLKKLGDSYTVAMWFNNGLPADVRAVAGTLYAGAGDRLSISGTADDPGKLLLTNGDQILAGSTRLQSNTWYFAVLCRAGTEVDLYLNGLPVPEVSGSMPKANGSGEILIGAAGDTDSTFAGRIDEVAVFDRCLEPTEIASLYRLTAR